MKDNLLRMKIEFEEKPILDLTKKVKRPEELDNIFNNIKIKLFGK